MSMTVKEQLELQDHKARQVPQAQLEQLGQQELQEHKEHQVHKAKLEL